MSKPVEPTNVFHIEFQTEGHGGYIKATKVTIESDMLAADDQTYRIDLANHPLYKQLQAYVRANPR